MHIFVLSQKKRRMKRWEQELTPYKRNVSVRYFSAIKELESIPALNSILQDFDRAYIKDTAELHPWQFFILAEKC
jgi:hypothetical protein